MRKELKELVPLVTKFW